MSARRISAFAMTIAIWGSACGGESEGAHGHGHSHGEPHSHAEGHSHEEAHAHDEESRHLTAWSSELELFAEIHEENDRLSIHAHLTDLDTFSPVEGEVQCFSGETPCQASTVAPGIYAIDLPTPSTGQLEFALVSRERRVEGRTNILAEEEHDHAGIELTKEQQWTVDFRSAEATTARLRETVEVTGDLTTPPSGQAHVHAPIAGRLSGSADTFPQPGTRVREGELLTTLAPTPGAPEDAVRADLAVVDAQSSLENARAERERSVRLVGEGAIPERRLAEAERGVRVAEASLAAARRARSLYAAARSSRGRGSWRITAPIEGLIDEVLASPGMSVDANEELFRIVNPDRLWVHLHVPEAWAPRLRASANAEFQLIGDTRWLPLRVTPSEGQEISATLINVGRSVDERTRTVSVFFELEGAIAEEESLRVGASLRARLPVGEEASGIRLPASAVLDAEGRDIVIVQREGELFEERSVRVALRSGSEVLITRGLRAGERVVTQGAVFVRLASRRNENIGHGHVH